MSLQPRRQTLIPWRQAPRHDNATHQPSPLKHPHPLHLTNNAKRNGLRRRSRDRRHLHQRLRSRTDTHLTPQTEAPTARHANTSRQLHRRRLYQRHHQAKTIESDQHALFLFATVQSMVSSSSTGIPASLTWATITPSTIHRRTIS